MKNRKIIFISLLVTIACLFGFFSVNLLSDSKAYAESPIFSVEQYTDSDYLLKADGSQSSKTIIDFAADVKAGKSTYYPELAEVFLVNTLKVRMKMPFLHITGKNMVFKL